MEMTYAVENIRKKLAAREFILGTNVSYTDITVTETLGGCGFDFIWIDTEHTHNTLDHVIGHLIACRACGVASFVRIPWNDPVLAKPVLDMGADGIIVPQIKSYKEALDCVAAFKYPPKGVRGWAPIRACDYGSTGDAYMHGEGDRRTLCLPQIENIGAVNDIEEICQIEGIDMLVVGPMDLTASLDIIGQIKHPRAVECYEKIAAAANKNNIPLCIASGFDHEYINMWISLGAKVFCASSDIGFIKGGAAAHLADAKRLFETEGGQK